MWKAFFESRNSGYIVTMSKSLRVVLCFSVLTACLVVNAHPPRDGRPNDQSRPTLRRVVLLVNRGSVNLARNVNQMSSKASSTGLTTQEMKSLCQRFLKEYEQLREDIEELRELAEQNGTNIQTDINPEKVWQDLNQVTSQVQVSPTDLLYLALGGGSGLSVDSARLAVSMAMLASLARSLSYEAKYNLLHADTLDEVQRSLDTILALGEAVSKVAIGIMETIEDAESQVDLDSGEKRKRRWSSGRFRLPGARRPNPVLPNFKFHQPSFTDRFNVNLGNGWSTTPSGLKWSNGGSTTVDFNAFSKGTNLDPKFSSGLSGFGSSFNFKHDF